MDKYFAGIKMAEMNIFYDFGSKLRISYFHADPLQFDYDKQLGKGDYKGINFPLVFKQRGGKKLCDIIETSAINLYLVSDRMKNILEENKLTGWQVFPIKLLDKKSNEILGYKGLSIIGRCSSFNYKNSKIIEKKLVPTGPLREYYKGGSIENWDGSDFFSPEKTTHIFVTGRAASVLKKNKISNLELVNLLDYERAVEDIKILGKQL